MENTLLENRSKYVKEMSRKRFPLEIDAMLSFDCRSCGSGSELQ